MIERGTAEGGEKGKQHIHYMYVDVRNSGDVFIKALFF